MEELEIFETAMKILVAFRISVENFEASKRRS